MKLKITFNNEKAIVSREKWGTIAFLSMMAFCCFVPPFVLYLKITSPQGIFPNAFIVLRIPLQTGHGFHGKVDTDSRSNWTVVM
jgi:hypothetical protein